MSQYHIYLDDLSMKWIKLGKKEGKTGKNRKKKEGKTGKKRKKKEGKTGIKGKEQKGKKQQIAHSKVSG